jgi:hypothetical protein
MLALALVAIIIACIVLYYEVADYGQPPYPSRLEAPIGVDLPAPWTVAACCGSEIPSGPLLAGFWKTPVDG